MNDIKQEIIQELNSRIERLKSHDDHRVSQQEDNQYAQLNHAVSRIIGVSLCKELEDVRQFVNEL